jgi:hypothetical protein
LVEVKIVAKELSFPRSFDRIENLILWMNSPESLDPNIPSANSCGAQNILPLSLDRFLDFL